MVGRCHGVCLQFVIVVFPDHTHLLFLMKYLNRVTVVITIYTYTTLVNVYVDLVVFTRIVGTS